VLHRVPHEFGVENLNDAMLGFSDLLGIHFGFMFLVV